MKTTLRTLLLAVLLSPSLLAITAAAPATKPAAHSTLR